MALRKTLAASCCLLLLTTATPASKGSQISLSETTSTADIQPRLNALDILSEALQADNPPAPSSQTSTAATPTVTGPFSHPVPGKIPDPGPPAKASCTSPPAPPAKTNTSKCWDETALEYMACTAMNTGAVTVHV